MASIRVLVAFSSHYHVPILNPCLPSGCPPSHILQQFTKFFEANDPKKGGSFYIQSKIYRAKEAIEYDLKAASKPEEPEAEPGKGKDSPKKDDDSNSSTSDKKR